MTGPALNREEIEELILSPTPLISGAPHPEIQLQPNGYDLTVAELEIFNSPGTIFPAHQRASIPAGTPVPMPKDTLITLTPGPYLVTFNETITMPPNLVGLVTPRSSLLRCGATLHTGVWDAGYSGRSQALLSVLNPHGLRLRANARIAHMIFITMTNPPRTLYQGRYQGENTPTGHP